MTSEGTGTGVTETSPLVDEASLKKLRSQPIASDVDGLRKEIAAFKETYPVEDYDTFLSPRGPYKVPVMLNFNRTKRSTVYKALEMLAVRNEALALLLEKKRVADAVAKHASEHDLEEFDCPICLDTVIRITDDSIRYFSCCGNGLCTTCADDGKVKRNCPLCRAPDEADKLNGRIAARGIAWGQLARGKELLYESGSDEPISNNANEDEGLRLVHLAADRGEAPALRLLFKIHENGHFDQEQSEMLAFEYLKQAADKGCLNSQCKLAAESHETITCADRLHYATLACSDMHKKKTNWHKLRAAYFLGVSFYYGKHIDDESAPDRNLYLAKHYLTMAAGSQVPHHENINIHAAYKFLGFTLLELFEKDYRLNDMSYNEAMHKQVPFFDQFEYDVDLEPGYSAVPLAMYWLKEDQKRQEKSDSWCTIAQLTKKFKNSCANCGKGREDKDLSKCSRCHVSCYCSKDAMHWKNGHKIDCVPKKWLYVDVRNMMIMQPDGSALGLTKLLQQWVRAAYILCASFYCGKCMHESSPDRNLYPLGSTSDQIHSLSGLSSHSARQTFFQAKYYLTMAAGSQVPDPENINIHAAYKFLGFTLLELFKKDYRQNDMSYNEAMHKQVPFFDQFEYDVDLEPGYSAVPLAMYWLEKDLKRKDKSNSRSTIAQLTEKFKNSCASCKV